MKKLQVMIIGKRWFQKTCGNTYHTAEVIVNNKTLGKTMVTYGYGEQYVESGFNLLLKHNIIKGAVTTNDIRQYFRDNEGSLLTCICDVKRKRDL